MSGWQERTSKEQKIVIYSNRPPKEFKGGAVKVIADLGVDLWVGPADKPVSDEVWNTMSDEEKHALSGPKMLTFNGRSIKVYTFPIPQSMYDAQYVMMANELIWPIFHSADADALIDALKMASPHHKHNHNFEYAQHKVEVYPDGSSNSVAIRRDPEKDYLFYKGLNDLGNDAIAQLKKKGEIGTNDLVWVHDYQCVNAQGDVYTFHIPFPRLDFLQKVKVNGKSILASNYFQDLLQQMANHPVMTFQRAVDMRNFIEVVASIDPKFKALNPQAYLNGHVKEFDINESISLRMFGKPVRIMNIPINVIQDEVLEAAKASNLEKTAFKTASLDHMNLPYHPKTVKNKHVPLKTVLGHLLDTNEEHRIFLSVHRNDYSKGTLEKVYAAGNYLAKHPEEKGKTHFVFFMQPTRAGVPGEERYQKAVADTARGLRERWGDSILFVPEGLEWSDFLGLLRHPNTVAYLGTGRKDGHDIMLREAASVRADYPKGDPRAALAIVTTNGTGASDVLKGTKERPGAFIINSHDTNFANMHTELTDTFEQIVNLHKSDEGKQALAHRYHAASIESRKYDPGHFKDQILNVAAQIMR